MLIRTSAAPIAPPPDRLDLRPLAAYARMLGAAYADHPTELPAVRTAVSDVLFQFAAALDHITYVLSSGPVPMPALPPWDTTALQVYLHLQGAPDAIK